eukprot:15480584-Alexandrium_andersonii.AAC.1
MILAGGATTIVPPRVISLMGCHLDQASAVYQPWEIGNALLPPRDNFSADCFESSFESSFENSFESSFKSSFEHLRAQLREPLREQLRAASSSFEQLRKLAR